MKRELQVKQCLVHCCGHLHAQRGFWIRSSPSEEFQGGSEYMIRGRPTRTDKPTPSDSQCKLISCGAMSSEERPARIVGPGRLFVMEPNSTSEGGISVRVVQHTSPEYAGRVGYAQAPRTLHPRAPQTFKRQSASAPCCPELVRTLAQHFGIKTEVVKDVLATLSADSCPTAQELEVQALVMLSGMCDDSDSSSEGDSDGLSEGGISEPLTDRVGKGKGKGHHQRRQFQGKGNGRSKRRRFWHR